MIKIREGYLDKHEKPIYSGYFLLKNGKEFESESIIDISHNDWHRSLFIEYIEPKLLKRCIQCQKKCHSCDCRGKFKGFDTIKLKEVDYFIINRIETEYHFNSRFNEEMLENFNINVPMRYHYEEPIIKEDNTNA